jgi:hypothetical protein
VNRDTPFYYYTSSNHCNFMSKRYHVSIYFDQNFLNKDLSFSLTILLPKFSQNSLKLCCIFFISKKSFLSTFYYSELLYWKWSKTNYWNSVLKFVSKLLYKIHISVNTLLSRIVGSKRVKEENCSLVSLWRDHKGSHLVVHDCWKQESERRKLFSCFTLERS